MLETGTARCHCYCWSCRTTHAAGVVTWIGFKRAQVRIAKGEALVRDYVSSRGTRRKFCSHCGTRIAFESEHNDWGDEMHLPLALFVTPVAFVLLAGYHQELVPLLAYRSGPPTAECRSVPLHIGREVRFRPERRIRMELTYER